MGWSKSSVYGTIELAAEAKDEVSDDNSKPGTDDPSTGNTEKPGTNNSSTGNTEKPGTGKPAINKPSADKPATGSTNKPLANKAGGKKSCKDIRSISNGSIYRVVSCRSFDGRGFKIKKKQKAVINYKRQDKYL